MFDHDIYFSHNRQLIAKDFATPDANSAVSVTVNSGDLVEAWSELLSRLPNDLYAALQTAIEKATR